MEELIAQHYGRIDPEVATAILRDRSGIGNAALPLGNRSALDPMIATHSVVADLTARVLWVSEGPHTLGRYRAIDLGARLAQGEAATAGEAAADLPEDPLLGDGTYERYRRAERVRHEAHEHAAHGQLDAAVDLYRRALVIRDDDHVAWRGLALAEERLDHHASARAAWSRVLALTPEAPEARREAEEHAREQ
jgi:tetratricopeptide (TPR) repeat protein